MFVCNPSWRRMAVLSSDSRPLLPYGNEKSLIGSQKGFLATLPATSYVAVVGLVVDQTLEVVTID